MKSELYAHTRRTTTAHNEQRTGERRLAVLASIRASRNLGRAWNVAAAGFGVGIAAALSGLGLWQPTVSAPIVVASLAAAAGLSWAAAALLPRPAASLFWFATPIAFGLACAAIQRQWPAFGALCGCMVIPLLSLALYQNDSRRAG